MSYLLWKLKQKHNHQPKDPQSSGVLAVERHGVATGGVATGGVAMVGVAAGFVMSLQCIVSAVRFGNFFDWLFQNFLGCPEPVCHHPKSPDPGSSVNQIHSIPAE